MNSRRRKTLYFTALGASAALMFAACATPADDEPAAQETVIETPAPTTDAPPVVVPPMGQTTQASPLGTPVELGNNLTVNFTEVGPGTDPYTGQAYTTYEVSVTNNGTAPYDPALVITTVNHGEAGTSAQQVFDSQNLGSGWFQGTILPGGTQTVKQGYAIPAGEKLVVTVTTGWEADSTAVFTS